MDQSLPTRKHRPLRIRVSVFECISDVQIRDFSVDIANGNKREWLYDLILWATLNGKAVEIQNVRDDV